MSELAHEHRPVTPPRINWQFGFAVLAFVVGLLIQGFNDNRQLVSRIVTLEAQYSESVRRFDSIDRTTSRIDAKLDMLLERQASDRGARRDRDRD